MVSRRQVIQGGAAVLALGGIADAAAAAAPELRGDGPFDALLAASANEILLLSPEQATQLGVDKGALAGLRAQLSDASPAGDARWAAQARSMQAKLLQVDRASLPAASQIRLDAVRFATERALDGTKFRYGGGAAAGFGGGAQPYVISQQNGSVVSAPEFLNSVHPVQNKDDAEAYLARVAAFARVVDQETARCTSDAAMGVMPPDFIAAIVLTQLRGFRAVPAAQQPLVDSLASAPQAANVSGDWAARCTKIVEIRVYPAVDRQIAAFAKATANAPSTAGVQRLPDGDAFYAWALRMGTTTDHLGRRHTQARPRAERRPEGPSRHPAARPGPHPGQRRPARAGAEQAIRASSTRTTIPAARR